MKTILILGEEADESIQMVVKHLYKKSADFIIFDTKKFPSEIGLSIAMSGDKLIGDIIFPDRAVSIFGIGAVWNRRLYKPIINSAISDQLIHGWTEEECYFALESFLSMIDNCAWMNPIFPEEKVRYNKLVQMDIARKIGFEIPSSIVSNIPSVAKDFHNSNNATIIKPLKIGFAHNPEGKQHILYTTVVPRDLLCDNAEKIHFCPVFFQEKIEKKLELRIIVVGQKVFACAIDSQSNETTATDWRKQIFLNEYLPHTRFDLPDKISTQCVELLKRLGLLSGSIDMILTPDNRYVFLEINQNGQWGWIEILAGLPISEAIADLLIEKSC